MEGEAFKKFGTAMMDYIVNYLENIRERKVLPDVQPGYLRELIPTTAPEDGQPWQDIMKDIERVIMPGVTHWHSPQFHAYYPTANSYPAIVADMLSDAIGCIGFTWIASPACTELEVVVMDWLGQMIGLPEQFLSASTNGKGGGVIQGTASEATLVALLSARAQVLRRYRNSPDFDEAAMMGKLVAYTSDQSHSAGERAGMLGAVQMRHIKADNDLKLRGEALRNAIEEDKAKGLIPFFVLATLGTTNSCAFDALDEIGEVCERENIWLHVDAAYAGSAFICEEYRYLMAGVEKVHSFNFNPHKWLLVNFDCSAMWVTDSDALVNAFNVDPLFLKHDHEGKAPDYRIPLGRRFRSLKLWFVMRIYGVKAMQEHIRGQIRLAKEFETLISADPRFEVMCPVILGLVCFRVKNKQNEDNERLLKLINERRSIHIVPAKIHGEYILRFAVCSRYTNSSDIQLSWKEIQSAYEQLFGAPKANGTIGNGVAKIGNGSASAIPSE